MQGKDFALKTECKVLHGQESSESENNGRKLLTAEKSDEIVQIKVFPAETTKAVLSAKIEFMKKIF